MLLATGCVNQHPAESEKKGTESVETMLEIKDPAERQAVLQAKAKVKAAGGQTRIIATSPAVADICDRLDLKLVGVCKSKVSKIPARYKKVKKVGLAMSPDMEIVASLHPDWILSPSSLQTDLEAKYKELDTDYAFLNLKSVTGMYRSIQELGEIFGREREAEKLTKEFLAFYKPYEKKIRKKKHPKVLILMGLPGSYVVATENSYVGSLVKLAGGDNVYSGSKQEFLNVNTEDMKKKEPDIILRTAHALPDQVKKMFQDEFRTNDVWKHYKAVKEHRVYDLDYEHFGMSADFDYQEALKELEKDLYGKGET